jgi:hypothetical protein
VSEDAAEVCTLRTVDPCWHPDVHRRCLSTAAVWECC